MQTQNRGQHGRSRWATACVALIALGGCYDGVGERRDALAATPGSELAASPATSGAQGVSLLSGTDSAAGSAGRSVSERGGERRLLLSVNWTSALGNTTEAVTDGGKLLGGRAAMRLWNCGDWATILSVVDGREVGLPRELGNALQILSGPTCGHTGAYNVFELPRGGEFWGVRYYVMNGSGQTDIKQHPMCLWPLSGGDRHIEGVHLQIGTGGTPNGNGEWIPSIRMNWRSADDSVEFEWGVMARAPGGGPLHIPPDTWVRYEWIMEWIDSERFRFLPRLYDMDGNVLADTNDWRHVNAPLRLQDWYDADPGNVVRRNPLSRNPDSIRSPTWGQGQSGASNRPFRIAAVAIGLRSSADDFIGPASPEGP
jgi:hypothetical protein